jgi:ribonuclease P protein component
MVCPDDQRFPKSSRLRKRAEFLAVQERGSVVQTRAFVGVFLPNQGRQTRLGITTTRKLGGAVVRNRARRLVREAFRRRVLDPPAGLDLVVIAKRQACALDGPALLADLELLGQRVRKTLERQG